MKYWEVNWEAKKSLLIGGCRLNGLRGRYSLDSDSVWARCCHRKVMGSNPGRGSVSLLPVQYIYLKRMSRQSQSMHLPGLKHLMTSVWTRSMGLECVNEVAILWLPSWCYSLDSDSVWASCYHRKVMGSNPRRGSVFLFASAIYLFKKDESPEPERASAWVKTSNDQCLIKVNGSRVCQRRFHFCGFRVGATL